MKRTMIVYLDVTVVNQVGCLDSFHVSSDQMVYIKI